MMAIRFYPNIKRHVYGLDNWVNVCRGMDVTQMFFAHEGAQTRRYMVVRKKIHERPQAGGKPLFADPSHRFSCYVTNMYLPANALWNVYHGRADCENRIKELKQDFGLEPFCLKGFWATEAAFRFIMMAYTIPRKFSVE